MLISQKSKEIIERCRFCWMCRHICPVGNATGQERNTARARALALSLVERGAEPIGKVADNIYECALCGACTKECVTGWDPVKFTREVRTELALEDKLPDYIKRLVENICENGNVYGQSVIGSELKKEIASLPEKADTLLFLGRDSIYKSPDSAVRAIKLLKAAGVEFTVMDSEPDSGYAMDFLTGATSETKEIMEACREKLAKLKTVICYDPADAKEFLREYKEWGISIGAKVATFTSYLADLVREGKLKPQKSEDIFTFQDPALLSRDIGETEPQRYILDACGCRREMIVFGKDTMLAGNLIMNEYMPGVMRQVAKLRWQGALNTGAQVLVTASPAEYEILKSVKPANIELKSIEEVLLNPQYELKTIMFGSEDRFEMRDIFHTIERHGPDAYPIPQELYDEIEDADILMVHICPVPASLIARGNKLRAILTNRGGLENIDLKAANARNIPVLNNPAHNSNGVCELAMGLIITETRNIARSHVGLKQGTWREYYDNTGNIWELKGKTVGIVGFGNIGHLMAERLNAFGCKVLVNDIHYEDDDEIFSRLPITRVDLPTLMKESDIVTLHARNESIILKAELLAMMKPSAFFINTARAHMVDYGALYTLLRDHKIMGAALEVHPVEPISADYPFLTLDNVTLTTHRAGDTLNAYSDSPEMLVIDYARYLDGKKPRFFVNPQVGYGR